jgi:hypothetical protein
MDFVDLTNNRERDKEVPPLSLPSSSSIASSSADALVIPTAMAQQEKKKKKRKLKVLKESDDSSPVLKESATTDDDAEIEADADPEMLTLMFRLNARIVGKRYYNGNMNDMEMIHLVREPQNPYGTHLPPSFYTPSCILC